MPISGVAESTGEEAALSWFEELGYAIVYGPDIAAGELFSSYAGSPARDPSALPSH
jgi:hypothetical protein